MLGKRPCVLRTSSSRSLLIPGDDVEGEPATLWKISQVTDENPSPAVSAPWKIVIGFDVGAEKKPPADACESPRSVLDPSALVPSQEKQQVVARSWRSGLGNLLAAKSGRGGTAVGDHIPSEEGSVLAGSFKAAFCPQAYADEMCLSVKLSHCGSKGAVWLDKANLDFMDADIFSGQRQACFEDEHLDADISPRRSHRLRQAMCVPCSQDMNFDSTGMNISLYQRGVVNACFSKGLKDDCLDAGLLPQSGQASWQTGEVSSAPRTATNKELMDTPLSPREGGASYFSGVDDCKDACKTPQQVLHKSRVDMGECEVVVNIQPSIFSATSPPSCPHSQTRSSSGFLKMCAYCGHSLQLGKDIFMYRGDQAFCSAECRYQKIVTDEGKDK